jgi:hypothetical protein
MHRPSFLFDFGCFGAFAQNLNQAFHLHKARALDPSQLLEDLLSQVANKLLAKP